MSNTQSLTDAQAAHVAAAPPECRADMAGYLAAGASVVIYRQSECGKDVPPFALGVEGTDFWIDCCDSPEDAVAQATKLGLPATRYGC